LAEQLGQQLLGCLLLVSQGTGGAGDAGDADLAVAALVALAEISRNFLADGLFSYPRVGRSSLHVTRR
jgi:hypothetical protein